VKGKMFCEVFAQFYLVFAASPAFSVYKGKVVLEKSFFSQRSTKVVYKLQSLF
jgi:hypothetical protein